MKIKTRFIYKGEGDMSGRNTTEVECEDYELSWGEKMIIYCVITEVGLVSREKL